MRKPANDDGFLSFDERKSIIAEAHKVITLTESFDSSKAKFHEIFQHVAKNDERLMRALSREFKLSAKEENNFFGGSKAPKPSDMREMVRFVRGYAEGVMSDPDNTPCELPPEYLDAVEGRVAPNLPRMAEERPSHRPGPQARQCGQMHAPR